MGFSTLQWISPSRYCSFEMLEATESGYRETFEFEVKTNLHDESGCEQEIDINSEL